MINPMSAHEEKKARIADLAAIFLTTHTLPHGGYSEQVIDSAIISASRLINLINKTVK